MKFQNLSVKRLFGRVALGLVLSMSGITIALFLVTKQKDIYDDGRLFLDFSEQTASLNGKPLTLSPMEYKMLNLFRKNPRQVLTRGQLLEKLWDIDERFVDEHTLTTSISRIRSKIESDGGAPYIKTVYGMGYQWTGGEAK